MAQKLIELGADVNSEDINGQTALFYSAREGHKELSEVLIKNGASVTKQDNRKQTPLNWAKKNKKTEVAELLMKYGAIPIKEKVSKKNEKKKVDNDAPKKYALMTFKDGMWQPLNVEDLKQFMETNEKVGEYLKNPELINALQGKPVPPTVKIYDHWDKAAKKVLTHIWKQKDAWNFHEPVNAEAMHLTDYNEIITHPMDLGTIKQKLATCAYKSCQEFVNDVELVFSNCIRYNGAESYFGVLAKQLNNEFKKQCQEVYLGYYM